MERALTLCQMDEDSRLEEMTKRSPKETSNPTGHIRTNWEKADQDDWETAAELTDGRLLFEG